MTLQHFHSKTGRGGWCNNETGRVLGKMHDPAGKPLDTFITAFGGVFLNPHPTAFSQHLNMRREEGYPGGVGLGVDQEPHHVRLAPPGPFLTRGHPSPGQKGCGLSFSFGLVSLPASCWGGHLLLSSLSRGLGGGGGCPGPQERPWTPLAGHDEGLQAGPGEVGATGLGNDCPRSNGPHPRTTPTPNPDFLPSLNSGGTLVGMPLGLLLMANA